MPDSYIILRFVRGLGWDSQLIEWRTRAQWSHVEAVPNAYSYETFGAMLKGGVQYRNVRDVCYRNVKTTQKWYLPCTDAQNVQFWNFLTQQNRKPYDWRAILAFQMGERDWDAPDSWFCSELQMAALKSAGIWQCHGEAHFDRIDPGQAYLLVTSLPGAYPGQ